MYKPLLLLAATALIAATPAADLDKNGEITRAEFMAAADANFISADADFDGQLTKDEHKTLREAIRTEQAKARFSQMDADQDGRVSEAEMLAARAQREDRQDGRRAKMKDRIDLNDDGTISDAERKAAKARMKAKQAERKAKREDQRIEGRPRLDIDRDGLVSRAEYDAMSDALFTRMDADGNGILTKGEGKAHRQRRKGKKPGQPQ